MEEEVDIAAVWFNLRKLHGELAYLYKTGSKDAYRKKLLWDSIEENEAILRNEGVDVR